jgi:hypothetical protein
MVGKSVLRFENFHTITNIVSVILSHQENVAIHTIPTILSHHQNGRVELAHVLALENVPK